MYPSDINWLPHSLLKGIPIPRVEFVEWDNQNYGGYYRPGTNVLSVVADEYTAGTIAHEFAHHLQYCAGSVIRAIPFKQVNGSYEKGIRLFFLSSRDEMEALLFEHKVAKDDLNEWWLKKLIRESEK